MNDDRYIEVMQMAGNPPTTINPRVLKRILAAVRRLDAEKIEALIKYVPYPTDSRYGPVAWNTALDAVRTELGLPIAGVSVDEARRAMDEAEGEGRR